MSLGSRVWCRTLVGALLMALGASLELYDQPFASEDLLYQDGNDIDTGPGESHQLPQLSDIMLRKIIRALRLQPASDDRLSYRQNQLSSEGNERNLRVPEEAEVKNSVYKRLSEVFGGHHFGRKNSDLVTRAQQKWKIKKGKGIAFRIQCSWPSGIFVQERVAKCIQKKRHCYCFYSFVVDKNGKEKCCQKVAAAAVATAVGDEPLVYKKP